MEDPEIEVRFKLKSKWPGRPITASDGLGIVKSIKGAIEATDDNPNGVLHDWNVEIVEWNFERLEVLLGGEGVTIREVE